MDAIPAKTDGSIKVYGEADVSMFVSIAAWGAAMTTNAMRMVSARILSSELHAKLDISRNKQRGKIKKIATKRIRSFRFEKIVIPACSAIGGIVSPMIIK